MGTGEQPAPEQSASPARKTTPRKARQPKATPQSAVPVKAPPPAAVPEPPAATAEQPALVEVQPTPVAEPTAVRRPAAKAATPAKKATPAKRTPRKAAARPNAPETPPAPEAPAAAATPAVTEGPAAVETPKTVETPATAETPATGETPATVEATPEAQPSPEHPAKPTTLTPSLQQPVPSEAWAKLLADPGHAPELLALAAVETLGPRAQEWAARTRESYPRATDQALARLATRQFTRFGSFGSLFGAVAGSYAPIALLGTAALTHAEVVLHVAAAYGMDPTDPQRAVELLVLSRVHPTRTDAEAAVAAAKRPAYDTDGRFPDAVVRLGRLIATQTGGWGALRLANRFFPGTSLLAAVLSSHASAQSIGVRANSFYRAKIRSSNPDGSSV